MGVNNDVHVEPISDPKDFGRCFDVVREAFGRQVADGIWCAFYPDWDTEEGRAKGAAKMTKRWSSATKDKAGNLNTVFLKATVKDSDGEDVIAGVAIWVQASVVEGYGDAPTTDPAASMDLEAIYPGQPAEQRYLCQLEQSLHKRRGEIVKEIASRSPPAVMVLDLCGVDPSFQRRGIASKLVEWGLAEAKRRGGLEAMTEASTAGRTVYQRLGFQQEGPETEYMVDEEFKDRVRPSNIVMRTRPNAA